MASIEITQQIKSDLAAMRNSPFLHASRSLLETLGYESELMLDLPSNPSEFINRISNRDDASKSRFEFLSAAKSMQIIFQVTDAEIAGNKHARLPKQRVDFDKGNAKSFMFVAVELNGKNYPRAKYIRFTREVNKPFPMPVVVLFKTTSNLLTVAFVRRRRNKIQTDRDVMENSSFVREVDTAYPNVADLNRLSQLSLSSLLIQIRQNEEIVNFDRLLATGINQLYSPYLIRSRPNQTHISQINIHPQNLQYDTETGKPIRYWDKYLNNGRGHWRTIDHDGFLGGISVCRKRCVFCHTDYKTN